MGDAGEGWVDAEARIQERMEELQQERAKSGAPARKETVEARQIRSLELAKRELETQRQAATHPMRRSQLEGAIAEIDRRIAELDAQGR